MDGKKKRNIQEMIEKSKKAKQPNSQLFDKKMGKRKSNAKFNKVNFNG